MKKVLWIGDLRTVMNYGAVATSEAVRDLLLEKNNIELKTIDARSFFKPTPVEGWKDSVQSVMDKKCAQYYDKSTVTVAKPANKKEIKNIRDRYFTPLRWREYEEFRNRVVSGECFQYEYRMIEWADTVVVNSEGSIVNGTDRFGAYRMGGLYLLFVEYMSKFILKKQTFVINHSVDPNNMDAEEIIRNIYPEMDGIYVREKYSQRLLNKWHINNVRVIPDALFSHNYENNNVEIPEYLKKEIDFTQEYICIGDSSGIKNNFTQVLWDVKAFYTELCTELRKKHKQIIFIDGFGGKNQALNEFLEEEHIPNVNIYTCTHEQLYWILKGASIFISGRWHASIISLMARTPILLWGADSHKTKALYEMVNYPYKFFDIKSLPINIDAITEEAEKIIESDNSEVFKTVSLLQKQSVNNIDML